MKLLVGLIVSVVGVSASAQNARGVRPTVISQPSQDLDGSWSLQSVACANGAVGKLRYDLAIVRFQYGQVTADLTTEGCEINIEGSYSTDSNILTTEFSNGSWTSCSGAMPTYVLNRMEFRRESGTLLLSGTDLAPFATCNGEGELRFVAD